MVRLNRRSWVCPAGMLVSFHTIRFAGLGSVRVAGWNTKYQFMLNEKRVRRPFWGVVFGLGTLLGPEETPVIGVFLWLLPAWTV
jgi:hypothetical protein